MKNKYYKILGIVVVAIAVLAVASCDKDSGVNGSSKNPKLEIDKENITLSGSPRYDQFQISNAGAGILEWNVTQIPEWITLSELVGKTLDETVTISITTQFTKLSYGEYNGEIKVNSNGGQFSISIYIDYKAPTLKIDSPVMNLDRHYSYDELRIENAGGGELEWNISERPEWMFFESVEGKVYNRPESVPFRANIWDGDLDYGNYEGDVIIKSNGGDYFIKVFLSYHREEEVFPGIGAASVEIGDTYSMVKKRWGNPDKNWYVRPEKTVFIHWFEYERLGLRFSVETNSMILYGSGQVGYIEVFGRYDGLTIETKLGIGSTLQEIKNAYGEPDKVEDNVYYYSSGIGFKMNNNIVEAMIIVEEI